MSCAQRETHVSKDTSVRTLRTPKLLKVPFPPHGTTGVQAGWLDVVVVVAASLDVAVGLVSVGVSSVADVVETIKVVVPDSSVAVVDSGTEVDKVVNSVLSIVGLLSVDVDEVSVVDMLASGLH